MYIIYFKIYNIHFKTNHIKIFCNLLFILTLLLIAEQNPALILSLDLLWLNIRVVCDLILPLFL